MMASDTTHILGITLQSAVSHNPSIIKEAEQKLSEWESHPGFYVTLLKILSTYQYPTEVRMMAAIYLKNGVGKYWRKIDSTISDEDKSLIKIKLEEIMLYEPEISIVTQIALVISKIGRVEIKEWNSLLPNLMANIKCDDSCKQHRALMVTYHLLKTLSTKRLTGDKKIFHEIVSQIFDYLCNLWDNLYRSWLTSGASGDHLQRAHFALKILRILSVRGYQHPGDSKSILEFIPLVMARAKESLEYRSSNQDASVLLEKHIITLWKVVGDFLETHPLSFVQFLKTALEFCSFYGFSEQGRSFIFERVAIHAMNLMKGIILCPEFKLAGHYDCDADRLNSRIVEANQSTIDAVNIKKSFFTHENLEFFVRILITVYLPLSSSEIENWSDNPEEYAIHMEETGETWKYNLRQSAETLLVTFFKEFRGSCKILVSMMDEFRTPLKDPQDRQLVLAKDALYNAAGLTSFELYDEFCFDTWLKETLMQELSLPVPILHRRITWLIGKMCGVKIGPETRPTVYMVLLNGLKSSDVVVCLSSSQSLRTCVDDFDFDPEQFTPFLNESFHVLFSLLKDVVECDNKMRVLHTVSYLIERNAAQIKSSEVISSLTQYLPSLWGADHNMLKAAVMSTCIHLAEALGNDCSMLREFTFPIIQISTDLKKPEHVYLLEDGLELWSTLMEHASIPADPRFISLVDNLLPLLSISTEHMKRSLSLVNCYNLMYPEAFAERYGYLACEEMRSIISEVRCEGVTMILRTVELMLRTSPTHGPSALTPLMSKIFLSAYEGVDAPVVLAVNMSIISRLLLISESTFKQGIEEVSKNEGVDPTAVLCRMVEKFCEKSVHVASLERKKLMSIALLKLFSTADEHILHRTCNIFFCVGETLNDIMRTDLDGKLSDSLYCCDLETPEVADEWVTENDIRKKRLAAQDIVYSVDLLELFKNEVSSLRLKIGEKNFSDIMQTVDEDTMSTIKQHIK